MVFTRSASEKQLYSFTGMLQIKFWETPPEVHVRGDMVVDASEGNSAEYLQQIENLIECQYRAESLAQLRPISSSERYPLFGII